MFLIVENRLKEKYDESEASPEKTACDEKMGRPRSTVWDEGKC
jgi:hypothetical protein